MHPLVDDVVAAYLDAVDREAPGVVQGLYLVGSVALGDFRPHTSDVDFVAVSAAPLDARARRAIARAHERARRRARRLRFEGLYVTWDALAREPTAYRGPHCRGGLLEARSTVVGDPVTWHTLRRHGVACRGPEPSALDVCADDAGLRAWTLANLDTYWGPLLARASGVVDRWALASLTPDGAVWIVLGVSRLHYTLATGEIASKERAGEHALAAFPERWHRIVRECLRLRRGERSPALYPSPFERHREALAFGRMVQGSLRDGAGID